MWLLIINSFNVSIAVQTCSKPYVIVNGSLTPADETIAYQANYTYSCDVGFTLNGTESRCCNSSGVLEEEEPTCQGKFIHFQLTSYN